MEKVRIIIIFVVVLVFSSFEIATRPVVDSLLECHLLRICVRLAFVALVTKVSKGVQIFPSQLQL